MIDYIQLQELIIKPTLYELVMYSDEALDLLTFTCAVESDGGTFLKQIKGKALGIYQMEPETYNDIWQNYIHNRSSLLYILLSNFDVVRMPSEDRMIYDLRYATVMARLFYKRIPEKLPGSNDLDGLWHYYKTYYNTDKGKAEKDSSIKKYLSYIVTSG